MLKIYPDTSKPPENTLEELLLHAGEEDAQPPEPASGIPKQWVPGWVRWPIRALFLPLVLLDLFAQRIARQLIRPPFKQAGACKKRGACCHYILLPVSKGLFGKLFYFWNTQILGFYRRLDGTFESEGHKVIVMGCRYLSKTGKCTRYALRPAVCRKWPMIEYFGYPRILKGCGFKAVYRDEPDKEVY
jgi:Fe-S-cluster containining protein